MIPSVDYDVLLNWVPNLVTQIQRYAFFGCSDLVSVTIPKSMQYIMASAFDGCTSLAHVYYTGNQTKWGSISIYDNNDPLRNAEKHYNDASGDCGSSVEWAFDTATGLLTISGSGAMNDFYSVDPGWSNYCGSISTVEIGSGVTSIGINAFSGCTNLASISIPDSVKTIGYGAFYNCSSLTGVDIPYGVTGIRKLTFSGCTSLTDVTIPDSVTSIGESAFSDCTGLTGITIPNNVTTIGGLAFSVCDNLKDVTIYNSTAVIGEDAFKNCSSDLILHGWEGSTARTYATENGITFEVLDIPEPTFFLPSNLNMIEEDSFIGIIARAVMIPKTETSISGDPFADSSVVYIYGYSDSVAQVLAFDYGYTFIEIDDDWMANHER